MKKINGLDALRALAVLLVIKQHWGPTEFKFSTVLTFISTKILPSAAFAVDFFFVLSGFLITNILLNSKNSTSAIGKFQALKVFVIRRSLRIFPIYYLFLLFLFFIDFPDVRQYFIYYATYTTNFFVFTHSKGTSIGHTWSLAVEEQFYLIWPFIIIFIPNRLIPYTIIAFIILGCISEILTRYIFGFYSFVFTINCFSAFAVGALYSYSIKEKNIAAKVKRVLFTLLPVASLCYILLVAGKLNPMYLPTTLINAIISVNLIIYITSGKYDKVTGFIVDNKLLNSIGRVSYGIYLFHYIIPGLYHSFLNLISARLNSGFKFYAFLYRPIIAELLQFIFLIILSYTSYYLFEARFLKLKKYFDYQHAVN